MNNNINDNIFRAYDIRGIYGTDLKDEDAYFIGKAFGTILKRMNKKTTIVGYDNRVSSLPLFDYLTKGITETGIDVINIGLVTTPMHYYSCHLLKIDSGIMITASHNPKEYNGFKFSFNGIYNACGEEIEEFRNFIKSNDFELGQGKIINRDIKESYINYTISSINLGNRKLKIVVDSANGTSSIVIKDILDKLNIDYIPLFIDSDPNFPNHHPDPSVYSNLKTLSETVIKEESDVGFGYDGDADRLGLVDEFGKVIPIDHFMIIIIRDIINKLEDKRILFDVKCSKSLEDEIIKLGGTPILSRTGASYLKKKIFGEKILFGGELSGHVYFNERFLGYDDGIYASLRMIEILSNTDKNISELLEGINHYYSTPELKMRFTDETKFDIIEKVEEYCTSKNYYFSDIDGCKVIFEDGFALIRASNTGPNITMRFEAKTEERMNIIKKEFIEFLENI